MFQTWVACFKKENTFCSSVLEMESWGTLWVEYVRQNGAEKTSPCKPPNGSPRDHHLSIVVCR